MGRVKGSRSHRSKFWSMHGTFHGVKFDSGYEKKFLEMCYRMGIKVERSREQIKYQDATGKWHQYNPDFYLTDLNYTVEVKGSWAFRENHGFVREKFMAATEYYRGRYTLVTEKELKTEFVSRLLAQLVKDKG